MDSTLDYGFDSIKLDGCGAQRDLDKYAALFNATGKAILIVRHKMHAPPPPHHTRPQKMRNEAILHPTETGKLPLGRHRAQRHVV